MKRILTDARRGPRSEGVQRSTGIHLSHPNNRRWINAFFAAVIAIASAVSIGAPTARAVTCTGVKVTPATKIQALIDARPAGTTFCFAPGTYYLKAAIKPKLNDVFIGGGAAVLDGTNRSFEGFTNFSSGVTVRAFEIRNFKVGIRAGTGWTIENNDIHHNGTEGARLVGNDVFRNNHTHHNTLGGVFGSGANVVVADNEIDHNQLSTLYCSGKFMWTVNLVVSGNYAHDNTCPALWVDANGYNPLIQGNTVVNNRGRGIDCEISYHCVIRNNIVSNNNKGILVSSTPDAEIYGNTVANNRDSAIAIVQQGNRYGLRKDYSSYGPHVTKNNFVHDNKITMATGYTGVTRYGNVGNTVFSAAANNRFRRNSYKIGSQAKPWQWNSRELTWAEWRAAGHDRTGSSSIIRP